MSTFASISTDYWIHPKQIVQEIPVLSFETADDIVCKKLNHFIRNPLRRGLLSQPVIQVCVALPSGCVQAAGGGNCMPVVL